MAIPSVEIAKGVHMPQVGLGLWQVPDEAVCVSAVRSGLEAGYRHFDSAQFYRNEAHVGRAIRESGYKREDVFVTTKIAVTHFGYKHTLSSFDESLQHMQFEYVDLLLLHFPVSLLRSKSWRALEQIHRAGKARAIGVSNYTIRHLEQLLQECEIRPAINQVELHVFLQQPELLAYCKEQGITVEAYSPLAHGHGLDDPVLAQIAQKHHKTPAQIMLRWCIEVGAVPLPKSVHPERIAENFAIFDFALDAAEMMALKGLNKNMRTAWDPTHVP